MDNRQLLFERIDQNLADYHDYLITSFDRQTIIEMAGRISTMEDTHIRMKQYSFDDSALEYLLQFQNPLEVVADVCQEHRNDIGELDFAIATVVAGRDAIGQYPLVGEAAAEPGWARKFANVDVTDTLGKIAARTIVYHSKDFEVDKDTLARHVRSDDPEDKKLIWATGAYGTQLLHERNAFVKTTKAYDYLTQYLREDDLLYFVEITGAGKGKITGNVYELPAQEYAGHVRQTALPAHTVSIHYQDGRQLDVTRREYDDDRHRLMSEQGLVASVRFHPEDSNILAAVLRREQKRRDLTPPGRLAPHLKRITDDKMKAETERIVAEFKSKTEPDSPNKTHYIVKVSQEYAIHGDMDALFDSVDRALGQGSLYFSGLNDEKGIFAFVKHDPDREQQFGPATGEQKPSLLEPVYGKTLSVIKELREKQRALPKPDSQQKKAKPPGHEI